MPAVARPAPCLTVPAWPRSSSWPVPPPPGRCCRWASSAAAASPPAGDASPSGPPLGCSSGSRSCCWTSSARPVSWTGLGSAWIRSACGRSGGDLCGANPVDRAKPGCKLHLAVEGGGLPLSLLVTAANTNDSLVFEALLDDLPKVRTRAGGRRCRPAKVHGDKGVRHEAPCDRVG